MERLSRIKSKPWNKGWKIAEVIRLKFNEQKLTKKQSELLATLLRYS